MSDHIRRVCGVGLLVIALPQFLPAQRLVGRAVLPARTFSSGPTSGTHLGPGPVNGQEIPFVEKQPVQGFSAALGNGDGTYLAMADNGFGSLENSADFHLRVYRIRPEFRTARGGSGNIAVLDFIELRDPDHRIPFVITNHFVGDRVLTGADFDIECMQRAPDGTLWFGDEFGPFLLHTDATGRVLEPPFPLPDLDHSGKQIRSAQNPFYEEASAVRLTNVVSAHAALHRGTQPLMVSPSDPPLADDNGGVPWPSRATILDYPPRAQTSGGFEGMALSPDGAKLHPVLEKPLHQADPDERIIYEFDIPSRRYTGRQFRYRMDPHGTSIGDFILFSDSRGLIIERDDSQGDLKAFKSVYEVELNADAGSVSKQLLVDLLAIDDPLHVSGPPRQGDIGLGERFSLPFVTIESLVWIDEKHIGVLNDNNYPFSVGRHVGTREPDDTEFVVIELDRALNAER